jgi:Family of unknown function (DUF5772)
MGGSIEVVRYYVNRSMYEIPIKTVSGPKTVRVSTTIMGIASTVVGEVGIPEQKEEGQMVYFLSESLDITQEFLPLLGPNSDLHGLRITPKELGYSNLTFENVSIDGSMSISLVYKEDEEIDLSELKSIDRS